MPSVLWVWLEVAALLGGALVPCCLERRTHSAAAQFFLLCVVTLGAYMGGYHWNHIATSPFLVLVFMTCAVVLPCLTCTLISCFRTRSRSSSNIPCGCSPRSMPCRSASSS